MDEAARTAGADRVAFQMRLLTGAGRNAESAPCAAGGARRQAEVPRRPARSAGRGEAQPDSTGLGIVMTFGQERDMPTWGACAACVRVDGSNGAVTVEQPNLIVDAGTPVHPDSALAQVEGAAPWG